MFLGMHFYSLHWDHLLQRFKKKNNLSCFIQLLVHWCIVKIEVVSLGTFTLLEIMACSINIRNGVIPVLVVTDDILLCL